MDYWLPIIVLFGAFFFMLALGVPIVYAIGLSTLASISTQLDFNSALSVVSQKLASGLDSFTLLAIPFFILSGNIMNHGGIARRLINFARILGGRLPGSLAHLLTCSLAHLLTCSLAHCNILANMLFGAISGSAVASAAAMGGVMHPQQVKEGYDPAFSTAVNVASAPTGLLIPPSNTLIVYSLVSGGTSIAALFLAGYVPGILLGLALMTVAGIIAVRRGYPKPERPTLRQAGVAIWMAIPSIFLIVLIMGGVLSGIFTPTEASAIAVIYTLFLALVLYREISVKDLPKIFLESVITTAIVLLLIGSSMGMSWAMSNADVPFLILDLLNTISDNPIIILLIINIILLIIGTFMDMTPAVLIFTPIFLPDVTELGMDPIHFGIVMVLNMCIGICTPPVGSVLFVGCSVSKLPINKIIKPMLPFYAVMVLVLAMVTYIPQISMALPRALGY
ncbi:TPA: TRAP transporter large permease [Escherichia coli]|nr:TRAP transporter large permease [Escherichia coli]HBA9579477.1 TRAP transporter large permease [Escherichia coli]HBA9583778.1 TRAP transporter large permease [Escherichia coli]